MKSDHTFSGRELEPETAFYRALIGRREISVDKRLVQYLMSTYGWDEEMAIYQAASSYKVGSFREANYQQVLGLTRTP